VTSSNSGVLRQPPVASNPLMLGLDHRIDPVTATMIEEARAAAYEQGVTDGIKSAESAARHAADTAMERLRSAQAALIEDLLTVTADRVPGLMQLALSIARRIVDEIPEAVSESLASRIAEALTQIDDRTLVLRVNPEELAQIKPAFDGASAVTVIGDATLRAGDAVIDGTWAHADLTLTTAWAMVEESLDAR